MEAGTSNSPHPLRSRRGFIFYRPQSAQEPTSSEQLALDAEQDGTAFAEEQAETKRLKDENWARYIDDNPKGAGNTMNRG